MNLNNDFYSRYSLVQEMMETPALVRSFDMSKPLLAADKIRKKNRLLLTGEGSSRIFPAKNAVRKSLEWGAGYTVFTEGSRQASLYDLSETAVFLASNSGRTNEVVNLAKILKEQGNTDRYALTANRDTVLESLCTAGYVLSCGKETAVAATKSVVEQALFYEYLLRGIIGRPCPLSGLAEKIELALTLPIEPSIIRAAAEAPAIYFAGYNDGVAEELTLKTNEITRKKSDFLEGTYAVHGIEEVLDKRDVVIIIDPIESEVDKFRDVLAKGVGLTVIAVSTKDTPFPTIRIPEAGELNQFVQIAAGWNILVETGLMLGINLDKPERARKVGNEFTG